MMKNKVNKIEKDIKKTEIMIEKLGHCVSLRQTSV